jgi:hypothetical protein
VAGFATAAECAALLELGRAHGFAPATVDGGAVDASRRNAETVLLQVR